MYYYDGFTLNTCKVYETTQFFLKITKVNIENKRYRVAIPGQLYSEDKLKNQKKGNNFRMF